MDDNQPYDRIRDYLYAHGPASINDVASACDLSIGEVLRHQRRHLMPTWVPAPEGGRCTLCGGRADVNDLCDGCRRNLIARGEAFPDPPLPPDEGRSISGG